MRPGSHCLIAVSGRFLSYSVVCPQDEDPDALNPSLCLDCFACHVQLPGAPGWDRHQVTPIVEFLLLLSSLIQGLSSSWAWPL